MKCLGLVCLQGPIIKCKSLLRHTVSNCTAFFAIIEVNCYAIVNYSMRQEQGGRLVNGFASYFSQNDPFYVHKNIKPVIVTHLSIEYSYVMEPKITITNFFVFKFYVLRSFSKLYCLTLTIDLRIVQQSVKYQLSYFQVRNKFACQPLSHWAK